MDTTGTLKETRDYTPGAAVSNETGAQPGEIPIHVKDLQKSFGEQHVLRGITFEVRQGQTLSVLGRSGTGKSVLLKLIVGLQHPDSGSICVHSKEISGLRLNQLNEVRKKIGFLFQNAALYDSLSVEENVAFPLRRHAKLSHADRHAKVRELLASVGLDKDSQKMPGEISGGMQKRVGLARALALDPDILLFDEPTAGLDPITSEEISQLILKLQKERNMASIVVTHDIHSAQTVSDRVALLRDGQILIQGTFEDLEKSKEEYVMQFLNDGRTGEKHV
jgi:phospholipid/cholesterol/gamma-HCH transport system ATP-binding protein